LRKLSLKIIPLILFITLLIGCSNKDQHNPLVGIPMPDHVPGDVIIGLQENVSLEEVADFILSFNNISIYNIVSFEYYSALPKERMDSLKSSLEAKPYIYSGDLRVSYVDSLSKIKIDLWIINFGIDDRKDWAITKEQFQLTHIPYPYQVGLLKVEYGKEEEWINILSQSNLFSFVELNVITHTH
jgi:hypothetical protein